MIISAPQLPVQRLKKSEANLRTRCERLESTLILALETGCRDPLTQLYNRHGFTEHLDILLSAASRRTDKAETLVVLAFDIDKFKSINDAYGHKMGDEVLCAIADQLRAVFRRDGDIIARFGGEEFTVAFLREKEKSRTLALRRAEIVRSSIERKCKIWSNGIVGYKGIDNALLRRIVTISIGIAFVDVKPANMNDERADMALYKAKEEGRNRVFHISETEVLMPSHLNPVAHVPQEPNTFSTYHFSIATTAKSWRERHPHQQYG